MHFVRGVTGLHYTSCIIFAPRKRNFNIQQNLNDLRYKFTKKL